MKSNFFNYLIPVLFLSIMACSTPEPGVGTIQGKMTFEKLNEESTVPILIQNTLIALCKISDENGLPKGPSFAARNDELIEEIGVMIAEPIVFTDSTGRFTMTNVPVGTYLVLFHLFDIDTSKVEWRDVRITEAFLALGGEKIPVSGKPDFWEKGGMSLTMGEWNSQDGFTADRGMVCSDKLGFCFSVKDEKPHPIVKVMADSTVNVVLKTHFLPKVEK